MAINFMFPQLALDIQVSDTFNSVFVNPPKSRFVTSKGLLNADHTYRYTQTVIVLNNNFDFSLGPY